MASARVEFITAVDTINRRTFATNTDPNGLYNLTIDPGSDTGPQVNRTIQALRAQVAGLEQKLSANAQRLSEQLLVQDLHVERVAGVPLFHAKEAVADGRANHRAAPRLVPGAFQGFHRIQFAGSTPRHPRLRQPPTRRRQ